MSFTSFTKSELSAALARGIQQCVLIGSRPPLCEALKSSLGKSLRIFAIEDEPLATALAQSAFDQRKASLFIWLGSAGYRTTDAVLAGLSFIASLPKGTGVVFDYAVERTSVESFTTALDALASRIATAGGSVKYLIQPPAVMALLRGLGFEQITDLAPATGGRLVSAAV